MCNTLILYNYLWFVNIKVSTICVQMKIKIKMLILILCLSPGQFCCAQQTVFNVPNADVTEKGAVFLQTESQFRAWTPDAFWLGTQYSAIGIGHNTELDATLFNTSAPDTHNMSLGLGFKSAMPIVILKDKFPNREIKLTVGSEILISLQGNGVGNWSYAHLSGRLPVTKTRITSGVSAGTKQLFGRNTFCYIMAVEQPVTEKFSLIADWYSGAENYAGFLIAGVSYKLPKNTAIYLGYQIPNTEKNGKSGFVIEISKIIR